MAHQHTNRLRTASFARYFLENSTNDVEKFIIEVSKNYKHLGVLAFFAGSFVLLFHGVQMMLTNWRLLLIQFFPVLWIWTIILDLKIHIIYGQSFLSLTYSWAHLLVLFIIIIAVTMMCYFLSDVFAHAVVKGTNTQIAQAFRKAYHDFFQIAGYGLLIGSLLATSMLIAPRVGKWWFVGSLSVMILLLMVSFVSIPAQLVSSSANLSLRDRLSTILIGGLLGLIVCLPSYLVARLGLLLLNRHVLFAPGVALLSIGFVLMIATMSAVNTVKTAPLLKNGEESS